MTYRWITLGDGRSVYRRIADRGHARSDLPSPGLIRDGMDALRHPQTGEFFDSKSQFRTATKQNGGIELGTDVKQPPTRREDTSYKDDVGRALQMVKEGYKPTIAGTATEGWNA